MEQSKTSNLGLDVAFWIIELNFIDAYSKKTTDLILNVPIAAGNGHSNCS
jgi:hypothetical protein